MLASVASALLCGIDGQLVTVEVHVSGGIPSYTVVGLPDAAVRESRERIRAALLSSQLPWPMKRITVNLAPSGVKKSGAGLDLPTAVGLLLAIDELPAGCLDGVGVVGEVGLDGTIRGVPGVLAIVEALRDAGVGIVVVPLANAIEAELVSGVTVRPARTVGELRGCLKGEDTWPAIPEVVAGTGWSGGVGGVGGVGDLDADGDGADLSDVRGLPMARRALEIAAAGGHHLLMAGPPGIGKTMLARRLHTILPPLEPQEALEVTRIHSAAGRRIGGGLARRRPFEAPHHSATAPALIGGGSGRLRPGAVTLAHRGVLFLDELGEFPPIALEALREPLEQGEVSIFRSAASMVFPAAFTLVACTNPCPCGRGAISCRCSDQARARYARRLSQPLLDRFDLRLALTPPASGDPPGEPSHVVRERVVEAVARQRARYRDRPWQRNAQIPSGIVVRELPVSPEGADALRLIGSQGRVSARGLMAIRRVAQTLADLDGRAALSIDDLLLAAELRVDVI